jgi:hypothetical protein
MFCAANELKWKVNNGNTQQRRERDCRRPIPCPADLNADEVVDIDDLLLVIVNWT